MPKVSSTKKIHPYVPAKLYEDAESLYREQVAAKVKGAKITAILVGWIVLGWLISRAKTRREVTKIYRDYMLGKPFVFPVDGAS